MNKSIYSNIVKKGLDVCKFCEELIEIGDSVLSKHTSPNNTRLYHESCARKVNLI